MDPDIQEKFDAFRSEFDASKQGIAATYAFYYPKKVLFRREGGISQRSMDLSNIEKLLQDLIFDSRFCGRELEHYTLKNLSINDAKIVKLTSEKKVSPTTKYYIEITIESISI